MAFLPLLEVVENSRAHVDPCIDSGTKQEHSRQLAMQENDIGGRYPLEFMIVTLLRQLE